MSMHSNDVWYHANVHQAYLSFLNANQFPDTVTCSGLYYSLHVYNVKS